MKTLRFFTTFAVAVSFLAMVTLIVIFGIAYEKLRVVELTAPGDVQKAPLLIIFWLGALVFGALYILRRFPRFMVYPVKTTPQNVVFQATFAKLALAVISALASILFTVLEINLYNNAADIQSKTDSLLICILFACILLCAAAYFLVATKHGQKKDDNKGERP